ncbi:MAG: hypothetical protein A3A86_02415 [Elusimicrobia bacterium RIFCSPLOWO2_01_FULL_60_11]|nr:MAG: hypothetical protein A3A86_02415 [Elusimicrobia bacterium RIFCSPLOWO2_01_FULL_60_11]
MKRFIEEELKKIRGENLWRSLPRLPDDCINFSTNDYLGLSRHPKVKAAAASALEKYGAGGRSSRLISGTTDLHLELESKLAKFKNTEACMVFPSGFMANLGVIASLLGEGDAVIADRLNHASLIDAAKLSRARLFVYEHRSVPSLEKALERTGSYGKRLIVTDSLFSMDGDLAPLSKISALARERGAWLMIDDAHATGVLKNMDKGADIVMGTLSKALGSQGGFVCGSKDLIDFLVNRARPFIYTTALAPASCAAAIAALDIVIEEPGRRKRLQDLSRNLRKELKERFPEESVLLRGHPTPILPILTGETEKTLRVSQELKARGVFVPAIRPPTVPRGACRLRISLSTEHGQSDIDALLGSLEGVLGRVS